MTANYCPSRPVPADEVRMMFSLAWKRLPLSVKVNPASESFFLVNGYLHRTDGFDTFKFVGDGDEAYWIVIDKQIECRYAKTNYSVIEIQ